MNALVLGLTLMLAGAAQAGAVLYWWSNIDGVVEAAAFAAGVPVSLVIASTVFACGFGCVAGARRR